jgi:hypothetical protein
MQIISLISIACMVLGAHASATDSDKSTTKHHSITGFDIDHPHTVVPTPTRISHEVTRSSPLLKARWDSTLNPMNHHTTLNDYQSTPTPGIHFCDQAHYKGNCVYQQVQANPKICHPVPEGNWRRGGSFLVSSMTANHFIHNHPDQPCMQHISLTFNHHLPL